MSQSTPSILWADTIGAGASWSLILRRGHVLRLEDIEGGANAATVFCNFECPVERYNMPDTFKAQHTAHLTEGFVIYSDMGRILCSITRDTCGWHDPFGGYNDAAAVAAKYGAASYQELRNAWHRNSRDNLLGELRKYGLGARDLGPTLIFSAKSRWNPMAPWFRARQLRPGDYVELRAEMNVLVAIDTGQHPLDPNPPYGPKPMRFSVSRSAPVMDDDPCRLSRPENARGFINTERYFL